MKQTELLVKMLNENTISSVLDLGAGRGEDSILCASYHCDVDAVDAGKMKMWQFPDYLKDHPHITFHEKMIHEYLAAHEKKKQSTGSFSGGKKDSHQKGERRELQAKERQSQRDWTPRGKNTKPNR